MSQNVQHRIVDEDGELVPFHIDFELVRTEVRVWSGRNNHSKMPIEQDGILFTHIVKEKA